MCARMPGGPPQIFDESLLRVRERRAARRVERRGGSFLLRRVADDLAERMADVNREFERMLLVAPEGTILEGLPADTVVRRPSEHTRLGLEAGGFDLAAALLGPGQVNDLPGALIEMRRALKPDGLLMAAMFGGETLRELREALYADDTERRGGVGARVHPTVGHVEAAGLLRRAGLALPVVDFDRFTVRYRSLRTLVEDLRDLGLTNALASRDGGWFGKGALERIAARYPAEDGKFPATFEVLWLTGWAPHESQQAPLRPGSAKMRLADALGVSEGKLES